MKLKIPREIRYLAWLGFLAALVVAIELLVSWKFGNQTLSPLFSILALIVIAYRFNWVYVLFAAPIFCLLSYFLIADASKYPLIRTLTVLVGGGLAAWASLQKSRVDYQVQEFEAVLEYLPVPWLLSDSRGKVIKASTALAVLTGKSASDLVGMLQFAVLTPPDSDNPQKATQSFFLKTPKVQIHPFFTSRSEKFFHATYLPLVIHDEHCLLTILKDS